MQDTAVRETEEAELDALNRPVILGERSTDEAPTIAEMLHQEVVDSAQEAPTTDISTEAAASSTDGNPESIDTTEEVSVPNEK